MPDSYCDFNDCSFSLHFSSLWSSHGLALIACIAAAIYLYRYRDKKGIGQRIAKLIAWIVFLGSLEFTLGHGMFYGVLLGFVLGSLFGWFSRDLETNERKFRNR